MKMFIGFAIAMLFTACKNENQEALKAAELTSTNVESTAPKEGYGKVRLKCGSQIVEIDGKCGGVTNTGEMIIAVQDKTVPARVFTISFNTKDYPQHGKVYTIKKSDFMSEGQKPANEVYVGFSEITQKSQMDWSSDNASGSLLFQVNGNEIKCTFKDIQLQPSIVYNKGQMNQLGTASGEITLYKN